MEKQTVVKNIYLLGDKKIDGVQNYPVLSIRSIVKNLDFQRFDALVFTSKNAVSIVNQFNKDWKKIPSYVIAPQTAKIVNELGGQLEFVGKKSHGDQFAKELIPLLENKKVLYLSGVKTVSNLVEILNQNGIECKQEAVYETVCKEYKEKKQFPKNSIIIFSSPSTIECFFKNAIWDESFTAISIGNTTAKYFPKQIKPIISKDTSLQGCVDTAFNL